MVQPQGYTMSSEEHLVCKLKKSLYGLKQSPRKWHLNFDSFLASSGYTRLDADHRCYFKYFENSYIIHFAGSSMKEIVNLKA